MNSYLEIGPICELNVYPRIGGACALPQNIDWPKSASDEPCALLLSADTKWLMNNTGLQLPENLLLSVFVPFKPNSIDHATQMARVSHSAKALLHTKQSFYRQECRNPIEPARILIIDKDNHPEADHDEFCSEIEPMIGDQPTWLQNKIEIPGRRFVLQLLAHQIREHWPSHSSLFMGGVGYLFLDLKWDQAQPIVGELRLQYT